jgi:hypothetical protein
MERRKKVVELRLQGMELEDIAHEIHKISIAGETRIYAPDGYCKQAVHKDLKEAMAEAATLLAFDATELRQLELQRAEANYKIASDIANSTDKRTTNADRLFALDRCAKFQQRIAELAGLDAPKKPAGAEPVNRFGNDTETDRLRKLQALMDAAAARVAPPHDPDATQPAPSEPPAEAEN